MGETNEVSCPRLKRVYGTYGHQSLTIRLGMNEPLWDLKYVRMVKKWAREGLKRGNRDIYLGTPGDDQGEKVKRRV